MDQSSPREVSGKGILYHPIYLFFVDKFYLAYARMQKEMVPCKALE